MMSDNCNPFAGGEVPPCSAFLGNTNPIIKDGQLIFRNNNRVFYFISTSSTTSINYNANNDSGNNVCKNSDSYDGTKPGKNSGNDSDNKDNDKSDNKSDNNSGKNSGNDSDNKDDNKSDNNSRNHSDNKADDNSENNSGNSSGKDAGSCSSLGNISTVTNLQISLTTYIIGLYIHEVQLGNIRHSEKNIIHSDKKANDFICKILKNNPEVSVDYIPSLSIVVSNSNAILNVFTNTINITPLNYYILFVLNRLENHPGLFFGNNAYVTEDPINFNLASLALRFPFEE